LQPPNTPKRVQDDDNEEEDYENEFERQRKMRKLAKSRAMEVELLERSQKAQHKEPEETLTTEKPITDEEREKILKLVENEEVEVCVLNFVGFLFLRPDEMNMMMIPTLVFILWPNISLSKVLCGKAHCHNSKSTCPVKDLGF
jgi:hypothetical protein